MQKFYLPKIVLALLIICLCSSLANAYNFKCQSRNGWSPGNGRYSYQGITPEADMVFGFLEISVLNFNKQKRELL